jgi:hypothetical protein
MRPRRSVAAACVGLCLLLAFTVCRPPSTPGPLERDFEAYYAAGVTYNAGADPYSRAIWTAERRISGVDARRDELLPFVGPAAALPFWSLLARLPYRIALAAWTTVLLAALLTIVGSALRVGRSAPGRAMPSPSPRDRRTARLDPGRACFVLAMTIASAPVIGALALGQAALVAAGGVALAIVAYRARWPFAAGAATLLAALQPNLALGLAARLRSRRDFGAATCAAVAFVALTLAAGGGSAGFLSYLLRLSEHARAERFIAIQHTPAAIGYALGLSTTTALALSFVIALAVAGTTVVLIARERLDPTTATLFACAVLPLALPFFHQPDFVLEMVPIAVLALRARGRARALAAVAAVLVLVDWFGLAQRHGAAGQILALGFAVAFAFVGLSGERERDWRAALAGPATLATLAVIALPLAFAHPSPTWPDALPARFHAAAHLDAGETWGAEQRAAGLARAEPVWGLLRLIPLTGCIALAAALVADRRRRRSSLARSVHATDTLLRADVPLTTSTSPSGLR